ncbi:MAG: CRISPR-associated protein Cas4 [Thermotogae bacterium]|nr:MAG: CRISPR-associated protein Cas4 [Thermotogota bacterium]
MISKMRIGGLKVNYQLTCPTRLWLFSNGLSFEHTSPLVNLGKTLHEELFNKETKDIIYDEIAVDVIKRDRKIIEVKRGKQFREADALQVAYYLYYLNERGIRGFRAYLYYPRIRKEFEIKLTDETIRKLKKAISDIEKTVALPIPPEPKRKRMCNGCAYFYYCFS